MPGRSLVNHQRRVFAREQHLRRHRFHEPESCMSEARGVEAL
jgi:hypothetical protein